MNLSNSSNGLSVQSDRKCFFSSVMTSIWAPETPQTHSRRPASCPPPPCSHTAPRGTTKSPDSLIIINKKLFNEPEYCEKLDSHFSWRRPPSNLFSLAFFPLTNRIYSLSCYKTLSIIALLQFNVSIKLNSDILSRLRGNYSQTIKYVNIPKFKVN